MSTPDLPASTPAYEAFETVCDILDDCQVSLWPTNHAEPPSGHIHPEDAGHLARRIVAALYGEDDEPLPGRCHICCEPLMYAWPGSVMRVHVHSKMVSCGIGGR